MYIQPFSIDEKCDIKICCIFVDTAFLFSRADMQNSIPQHNWIIMDVIISCPMQHHDTVKSSGNLMQHQNQLKIWNSVLYIACYIVLLSNKIACYSYCCENWSRLTLSLKISQINWNFCICHFYQTIHPQVPRPKTQSPTAMTPIWSEARYANSHS